MRECGEALSLVVARADGLSALICSSEVRARKTQSARSDEIADEHPKRTPYTRQVCQAGRTSATAFL